MGYRCMHRPAMYTTRHGSRSGLKRRCLDRARTEKVGPRLGEDEMVGAATGKELKRLRRATARAGKAGTATRRGLKRLGDLKRGEDCPGHAQTTQTRFSHTATTGIEAGCQVV